MNDWVVWDTGGLTYSRQHESSMVERFMLEDQCSPLHRPVLLRLLRKSSSTSDLGNLLSRSVRFLARSVFITSPLLETCATNLIVEYVLIIMLKQATMLLSSTACKRWVNGTTTSTIHQAIFSASSPPRSFYLQSSRRTWLNSSAIVMGGSLL